MSDHQKHQHEKPGAKRDAREGSREGAQSQGGIKHAAVDASVNLQAGSPKRAVDVPGPSLDQGGGADPHDGRAHSGFTGDDGTHQSTDATGTAASGQPGPVGNLGAQQDQRTRGMPQDPAERMTGADTPNAGGIAGSAGGPRTRPAGDDVEDEAEKREGRIVKDAQRKPQI